MGSIEVYIKERKRDRLDDTARSLTTQGKFAEAARVYMQKAQIALVDNELIYSGDSQDAFNMWLRAGEIANAMEQARNALHGYTLREIWLTGQYSYLDNLMEIVSELYKTDHTNEADQFLTEINDYLISIDEEPIAITLWGKQSKFPASCPHCGGSITYRGNRDHIVCTYCKSMVYEI